MRNRRIGSVLGSLASCLLVVGCSGGDKKDPKKPGDGEGMAGSPGSLIVPKVDDSLCNTSGKRVETYDLNRDNQPDVWKLFATVTEGGTSVEVLTCKQVDFDHDGVKDYVVTYKDTGEMNAEEADLTFDGRFDARHHFDNKTGKVYLIERDTDFDKKPDVWEKFDGDGLIESVRRDTNADGKPDVWEQYVKGELVSILYDDDFDNKVDRKEQLVTTKPVAEPPPSPNLEPSPGPADEGANDAPKEEPVPKPGAGTAGPATNKNGADSGQ